MKRCWTNEEAPGGARTEASAARGWVRRRAVAAVCWGLVTGTAVAVPFTYQGRLVDGTALANGNYELRFRLFDSVAAGTQVGGDVALPTVGVTNGLFTVQLEFGNGVFTGADRWLELSARPAGDPGALSVFDPRQPITAVPYALYSLAGSGDAAALTSGLLPDARLSGNIARSADLLSFSNTFGVRLGATNDALQA
jgi:hypothetical protein